MKERAAGPHHQAGRDPCRSPVFRSSAAKPHIPGLRRPPTAQALRASFTPTSWPHDGHITEPSRFRPNIESAS